jgi:hypothetical protein
MPPVLMHVGYPKFMLMSVQLSFFDKHRDINFAGEGSLSGVVVPPIGLHHGFFYGSLALIDPVVLIMEIKSK